MSKKVSFLISIMLVIALLPISVFAANGPRPKGTEIRNLPFGSLDTYEEEVSSFIKIGDTYILNEDGVVNNSIENVTYDKEKNTLTLNNYKDNIIIKTKATGDDFTLNVVGENEIDGIDISGDLYGGSLKVDGDGTLIVHKDQDLEGGLEIGAGGTAGKVTFGKNVKVKIYPSKSSYDGIALTWTTIKDISKAIIFENGSEQEMDTGVCYDYIPGGNGAQEISDKYVTHYVYPSTWDNDTNWWIFTYNFEVEKTKIKKVYLDKTSYTYDGKAKKPEVYVYDEDGHYIDNNCCKISYSNNTKVGTATVTIEGKILYEGTLKTTFKINPKGTSISKLTATKKGFTAKWKKQATQTTGYQIRYSLKSNMGSSKTKTITSNKTLSKKVTGLKGKKKYYVQVRTYKTVNGKKYYSGWSAKKKVTTKK